MHLTGKQKRHLRAMGHALKPTLNLGKNGIDDAVLAQFETTLLARELVKVRLLTNCPLEADEAADAITAGSGATLAQKVGRTLLFYRAHPEHPVIRLPGGKDGATNSVAATPQPMGEDDGGAARPARRKRSQLTAR